MPGAPGQTGLGSLAGWWRRTGLRAKIRIAYILLLSIPLLIVAVAAYQTSTSTIEQNAQGFSAQLTGEVRDNLDTYVQQSERLTYWPFQSDGVQKVLSQYQGRPAAPAALSDLITMRDALGYVGRNRSDMEGIYLVTRGGTLFSWTASGDLVAHPKTTTATWYRTALRADPGVVFLPTGPQEMIKVATGRVFSVAATLHSRSTGAPLGAVRIDLDARALASVVQRISLGLQGRLLVITRSAQVVYPIDPSPYELRLARIIVGHVGMARAGRLKLEAGGASLLATYDTSASSGWMVAGVVPVEQLLSGANHLRSLILSVAAACIVAGALLASLILGLLTRPLRDLRNAMVGVAEHSDLDTRLEVVSNDEVGQLAHRFNAMLDEIRRLVDDVLRAQIQEREAELRALQNQINPHFLYNTLESINMLALTHDDREVSRMVTSLGRLLRFTISSSQALIALRHELEYFNLYLMVQHSRYGDRITSSVQIDESLLNFTLPKFTLQPIVENALYHGLEPQRGIGHVSIRGHLVGDELEITVEDNGVGIDGPTLQWLQNTLHDDVQRSGRQVGLANVHERLKLYCGPTYGLTVESELGTGTRVTFRVPPILRDIDARPSESKRQTTKDGNNASLAHS